jgi:RNA polymerase sigma-70 factor (ECF subfamily)
MTQTCQDLLVTRFCDGDEKAFEEVWRAHLPRVLWEIHRVTTDYDDVEELLQRTRIEAYRVRHSYRGTGRVGAWLGGVCRRCCLRWLRSIRRRRKHVNDFQALAEVAREPEVDVDAFEADYVVQCQCAMKALDRLTPRQRAIVLLRSVEQQSVADVADQLHCSQGTVKATYHKALAYLRTYLTVVE